MHNLKQAAISHSSYHKSGKLCSVNVLPYCSKFFLLSFEDSVVPVIACFDIAVLNSKRTNSTFPIIDTRPKNCHSLPHAVHTPYICTAWRMAVCM